MPPLNVTIVTDIAIAILISGSLFALIAAGFSLVYRVTKVMHLAHGVVVLGSGYVLWWGLLQGWHIVLASTFAVLVAMVSGWGMQSLVYELLRRRGRVATTMSLVATLALVTVGQNILLLLFGSGTRFIAESSLSRHILIGSTSMTVIQMIVIAVSLVCIVALGLFLRWSRLGKSMRAVADNETVAEVVGISSASVRRAAMLLASFFGGIAGVLYALEFNLESSQGVHIAVKAFSRAIVGGIGSLPGAMIGSFVLEAAENIGSFYISAGFKNLFAFVIVFIFLLFRPRGLFGEKRKNEEL